MSKQLIKYLRGEEFSNLISAKLSNLELNRKTVMFVEPYGATVPLLKRGNDLGYNIILLTANSDMRVLSSDVISCAAIAIHVDTSNEADLIDVSKTLSALIEINAVIPGFEYFVPIVSKISSLLSLPGIHPDDAMNFRRKDIMRILMKNAGLTVPQYQIVDSLDDLEAASRAIQYPLVCKPVDAAGSVHVRLVNDINELTKAASAIIFGNDKLWGYHLSKLVLLEEYIDGEEFSIEGIVQNGSITYFSITEKFVNDQIDFVEIGHIANAPLEDALKRQIHEYISNVIRVLKADNCPFHAEIRLRKEGQPVLMEIAARLAGDRIGELINLSRGVNYYDHIYAMYFGAHHPPEKMDNLFAGIRFFYRPEIESYTQVTGIDSLKHRQLEDVLIYYEPECPIPSFPKPLGRLGHVIAKRANYYELVNLLNHVDSEVKFS